jgi:hypothetical protein
MKLNVEKEIEAGYETAGGLQRAQIDYVRSVASSFNAVIDRLPAGPEAECAKQSMNAAVLWACMSVLNERKAQTA